MISTLLKKLFCNDRSSHIRQEHPTFTPSSANLVIMNSTINMVGRNQINHNHPRSGPIPGYDARVPGTTHTIPITLSVAVDPDRSLSAAAAQDHHGRSPLMVGVSVQYGISPPRQGAIVTTTHNVHSLCTPLEGIVLHVPLPRQVVTDNHVLSPSDLESNTFQEGNSRWLSTSNPSPCLCSYVRGTGCTISYVEETPIAEADSEDTSYRHATYPVHSRPSSSYALHSTNGQWLASGMTPSPPPPCVLPPIRRHDAHSYLDDESPYTNTLPLIQGAPPPTCRAHPDPSYNSLATSHQMQSTCGCGAQRLAYSPRVNGNENRHIFPQHLPSRSPSTGSLGSHIPLASPQRTMSQSALVCHSPSRACLSTTVTSPCFPSPVLSTTRSDTSHLCWDESETAVEVDCEKLPSGN